MTKKSFKVLNSILFKEQMLHWSKRFSTCSLFDSQHYHGAYHTVDCMLAAGCADSLVLNTFDYAKLKQFISEKPRWLFGHVAFEYQDIIHQSFGKKDRIGFPLLHLSEPEVIIQLQEGEVSISSCNIPPEVILEEILACVPEKDKEASCVLTPVLSKEKYLNIIRQLQNHILRGDCYEINFCQEFYGQSADLSPYQVYRNLTQVSPTPFSCFYKQDDKYLMCASPERFLQKAGNKIIAQPIKGTIARNLNNMEQDNLLKQELFLSSKERSENVMIVDLMRNDLSKIALEGTVKVEELFGIYAFPQVHQMISTIVGEVKADIDFADILQATFPMGSMTGAPKKRVLELIEEYEPAKRGLYSGSVGYITPEGDFDFNVVIRSILYNATTKNLSYQVGSGITFYSDAEKEYEECLLKAVGMLKALSFSS